MDIVLKINPELDANLEKYTEVGLRHKSYQQRIFIYFFLTFSFFTILILGFQFNREKNYRISQLESTLDNSIGFVNRFIEVNNLGKGSDFSGLENISLLFPDTNTRVTLIDDKGNVLYDNFVEDYENMENHLMRPEVQKALYSVIGGNIRHSETTGQDFYYFARNYEDYFIRLAVVYDINVENFLKTERIFIFFMIAMFFIMWGLLYLVTNRLGDFVNKLRDFAIAAGKNEDIDPDMEFMDSEFGDIQKQIVQIYGNLKSAKDELTIEKERLFNHLLALNEGIAFFSSEKKKLLANSHFIQYINMISSKSSISAEMMFEIEELKPIINEIDNYLDSTLEINPKDLPHFNLMVSKNEKYFNIQGIVFKDKSFEILISDITKPEKRRLLKQQITSNIAHELKTPLSSIKAYLETLMNTQDLEEEKKRYFIDRAYNQSERLNDLLNDISLLNNIEAAGDLFEFKKVLLRPLLDDVIENLDSRLKEKEIPVKLDIKKDLAVTGNDSLLFSIFQNLIENTINYAGEKVKIHIKQYLEDNKFYYFSYTDTGVGIPEEHLQRVFERFYRIDEGRTREAGGTGLGLAIVKNAIQLHKGEISVRNREEGGVEFLFSVAKK